MQYYELALFPLMYTYVVQNNVCLSTPVGRKKPRFDEIAQVVTIMSCFFIALVWLSDPGSHRSTGPHQPIGDCTLTTYTYAVTGMVSGRGGMDRGRGREGGERIGEGREG